MIPLDSTYPHLFDDAKLQLSYVKTSGNIEGTWEVRVDRNDVLLENIKEEEQDEKELQGTEDIKQSFLDAISDDEDEELHDLNEVEEEDEWSPKQLVKPRIMKSGTLVFGKKTKTFTKPKQAKYPVFKEPKEELSEYDKLREQRIKEFKQMQESLGLFAAAKDLKPKKKPVVRRSAPIDFTRRTEPIQLRSRKVPGDNESDSGISSGISTPTKRYFDDYGSDDEFKPKRRRVFHVSRWKIDPNVDVPTPDDITDDMLENIADFVSEKVYNPMHGTSCHQCRQKTLDTKSICRSGKCAGVRGAFCGICLKNRYNEELRVVLMDPEWECPPCRGICNCSICRNRNGKCATGQMISRALERGFPSVKEYLEHLSTKRDD